MRARLDVVAAVLLGLSWATPSGAGTSGQTEPFMAHGAGAATNQGDYISASTGGLDAPYHYFIEVPPGLSHLVVDLFDADVGAGGTTEAALGHDRGRGAGGAFQGTRATYTLFDPSGTQRATLTGDATAASVPFDDAWTTLYDSDSGQPPSFSAATSTGVAGNNTSITIAVPAATLANDLLIAAVTVDGNAAITASAAGWTQIDQGACSNNNCRMAVFGRYATAAEPANYAFTWAGNQEAVGIMLRYRGVTGAINTFAVGNNTGNTANPQAPSITAPANSMVVRLYGADTSAAVAGYAPAGTTGRANQASGGTDTNAVTAGAADLVQSGATGTANFTIANTQRWRAVTLALPAGPLTPVAGHWQVSVDMSSAVNPAGTNSDINAFGLRANDGDATATGTELNVYYDSQTAFGVNDGLPAPTYTGYPYVVSGCTALEADFDYDSNSVTAPFVQGVTYTSRTGLFTQTFDNTVLSDQGGTATAWAGNPINQWTTDTRSSEYGLWQQQTTIQPYPNSANYANVWTGNFQAAAPTPAANPTTNAFRTYLPTDGGAAPVKPYLEQFAAYRSGPTTPTTGQMTVFTITLRLVNPTAQAISFGAPAADVVTASVPGPAGVVTYQGSASATHGSVTSAPAVGATGTITWNPVSVPAATTATLFYNVGYTPTAAGLGSARTPLTGTPAVNGTRAVFVDETGNTTQTRATMTLGPICELAATRNLLTPAVVSSVRAHAAPGGVAVEWDTASEVGTAGFDLLRWDPETGAYVKLNKRLLPGLQGSPQGGHYRFLDEGAPASGRSWYVVSEVSASGEHRFHGPYDVAIEAESPTARTAALLAFDRAPRRAPASLTRALAARRVSVGTSPAPLIARKGPIAMQIGVERQGLYFVSTASIASTLHLPAAQVRALISGRRLSLSNQGQAVAWTTAPGGLLFYGRAIDSIYTTDNVYWLRVGPGVAMRAANGRRPSPAGPASFQDDVHAEENHLPATLVSTDPDADYWYWDFLSGGDPAYDDKTFPVTVTGADANGGPGRLRARLQGATTTGVAGEHHVAVSLNGSPVGEMQWEGIAPKTLDVPVSPSLIHEGSNSVELKALLDPGVPYSILYVDSFDLDYDRVYQAAADALAFRGGPHGVVTVGGFSQPAITVLDVSEPARPLRVVATTLDGAGPFRVSLVPSDPNASYLAVTPAAWLTPKWIAAYRSAGLKSSRQGADYVILTSSDMVASAGRLASLRQKHGLRASVVDVADVMAEFSNGISDPRALQSFLKWAAVRWSPAPRYVLLAGLGTFDYKDNLGFGGNLVPPLMVSTPSGLFASDNHLADLDGDGVPDMAVGRVPVVSASELDSYVGKIEAYEASDGGTWKDRALWLADRASAGADFPDQAESLVPDLSAVYSPDRIYLADGTIAASRAQLMADLDAGAGILNYVGHGGIDRLSADGLLVSTDVPALTNGERLPFMTALTCTINRFEVPGYSSLGGTLVKSPGGGVSAVWAPTGLSLDVDAHALGGLFYSRLASTPSARIGDVVREALRAYGSAGRERSLLSVYNLLGDPAITLKAAPPPSGDGGPIPEVRSSGARHATRAEGVPTSRSATE